ncbi:hypothetical protein [Streptomyces sp. RK9]|uniref:hypothetical protein n=1 Tax=Streptomyces sp. RK9 TaxID=3239284 RepID=UPI00386C4045
MSATSSSSVTMRDPGVLQVDGPGADTPRVMTNTHCLEFTCPAWCSMRLCPEDHSGSDGTDVTRVLHMGPMAGLTLNHHTLFRSAGYDMNLYAYTLPDGAPGRPFVRIADGDDTVDDYFDTHSIDALQEFRDRLVASLAGLTEYLNRIQDWDRSASRTARAWDEAARRDRPCQGSGGQSERCARCDPDGATPGEQRWLELMHAASPT